VSAFTPGASAGHEVAKAPAEVGLEHGYRVTCADTASHFPTRAVRHAPGRSLTPNCDRRALYLDIVCRSGTESSRTHRWREMDSKFQFGAKTGSISTLRWGWGRSTVDAAYHPSGRRPRQTDRPVSAARSAAAHRQMNAPTLLEVARYCGTEISQSIPLPAASLRTFGPWAPEEGIFGLHRDQAKCQIGHSNALKKSLDTTVRFPLGR
jgi:hypothetical protein